MRRTGVWALLSVLAVLAACGSSSDEAVESGSTATSTSSTSTSSAPSTTEPEAGVPLTRVAFGEIGLEAASEIEQVLGFAEGGDNPCFERTPSEIRDQPILVDDTFRDSEDMQIGWQYSFCWGGGFPAENVRLFDPNGRALPSADFGPAPVVPGAPTGTYTVTGTVDGQPVEAGVEVVPTRDPRMFVDPRTPRASDPGEVSDADDLELYIVGFVGRNSIPIALYGRGDFFGDLIGVFDADVDSSGAGHVVIAADGLAEEQCVTVVADPELAVEQGSYVLEEGVTLEFDTALTMAVPACFASA